MGNIFMLCLDDIGSIQPGAEVIILMAPRKRDERRQKWSDAVAFWRTVVDGKAIFQWTKFSWLDKL